MKRQMMNHRTGARVEVKEGFSWTTLFFGVFVPLARRDWGWAIIMFITALITFGLSWLVMPFIYNKIYIKGLLKDGFEFV